MPPRRAKNFDRMDCSTSPSLTNQKSPANTSYIQPETPATMVNTSLVGTSQRVLRKRPPPPPVSDVQQSNGRTSLRAKGKVQSKPQDHHVAESISKFDNEVKEENHQQSTKVVSLIHSSSRRIGQGRPPIAPSQVPQSSSLENLSVKHLVSAQILPSEENMFQKQTPGNRNIATLVMENTETPVTSIMKSNRAVVRSSTRNARAPMTEVVKNGSIPPVRSSARIKKAELNEEEAPVVSEPKKSTVVASKRNSASEKLQPTTAKRAKKDCKGSSDKDILPTPIIPSGTKRGRSLSTSKSLEILCVQSDNPSLKDEGVSQPIRKRGRRCNSTKSVESVNIEENMDIQNQIVMKSIENIKDLEERVEEKVEAAAQPKRRRPSKTLTKMTEETKHLKVTMESTSLRDLTLGESPPQFLRDLSIDKCEHGINASDSKDDTQICATLDTTVSSTAQRGKKNVNKKAASRTNTRTNKKADSSASLVDTVPLASLGEMEPLKQSSDVIIISAAMKKVNKKPSLRLSTRATSKNVDSSISLVDTILSAKSLEVSNTSAALPSTLDRFPLHTIGDDEESSHPNSDEIAQLAIELLKQKAPQKMAITEGRNTKQRISSKAAQKAPPLPSVTEDELDEQQTSLAMDELKNTQKADGILNSKTQISIAMDELDNAQYANEKLNSNVQTGEKKGVTKKRPLQENVLKMKRLKKSTEMPCARTPNSTHTTTEERANVKRSGSATKHGGDWDANEITNTGGCKLRNDILQTQGQGKVQRNRMLEFDALPVRFGLGISGL